MMRRFLGLKLLIAFGKIMVKTPGEALVTLSVPQDSIGTAFAIKNILSGLILFFGPLYGGILLNTFGSSAAPVLEAVHWFIFVRLHHVTPHHVTPHPTAHHPQVFLWYVVFLARLGLKGLDSELHHRFCLLW